MKKAMEKTPSMSNVIFFEEVKKPGEKDENIAKSIIMTVATSAMTIMTSMIITSWVAVITMLDY